MTVILKPLKKLVRRIYPAQYHLVLVGALINHRLQGSPVPPPHLVKLYWLNCFRKSYSLRTLIETGTYYGTTVAAMIKLFEQIYTIELDYKLYTLARERFLKYPHVHVIQGDSGKVLPIVLENNPNRCLFWLDGHFSGDGTARGVKDTPIIEELAAIRSHYRKDHVILIDDARMFTGRNGYPTLKSIYSLLKDINSSYIVKVVDDIIQAFLPKRGVK